MGQLCLKLGKHRGAQARGASTDHAGDLAATGVAPGAHCINGCSRPPVSGRHAVT